MSKLPFKRSLNALKPPTVPLAPKRLLGFREWCQQVYEPNKRLQEANERRGSFSAPPPSNVTQAEM